MFIYVGCLISTSLSTLYYLEEEKQMEEQASKIMALVENNFKQKLNSQIHAIERYINSYNYTSFDNAILDGAHYLDDIKNIKFIF